jgi:hypothetical protein
MGNLPNDPLCEKGGRSIDVNQGSLLAGECTVSPWDLEESGGAAAWIRGPKAISVLATVLLGASLQHYLDPIQLSATDPEIRSLMVRQRSRRNKDPERPREP